MNNFRCARGCGRLVYFEGDTCWPPGPDKIRRDNQGACLPWPPATPAAIKEEMARVIELAEARKKG